MSSSPSCPSSLAVPPVVEYGHDEGFAITGGYVYRGSTIPDLAGAYVFADFGSGRIWAYRDGQRVRLPVEAEAPVSFGEDESGELYVLELGGAVRRLVPA